MVDTLRDPPTRTSRRSRNKGRGARLRPRDVEILMALAKMRLLRTSDIARLFFAAKSTGQKRLRKLFDLGLVRAVVTDLASENRYALTRLGYELLLSVNDGRDIPPFRPAPRADGRSLVHLDLLNSYRIALATGCGAVGIGLQSFLSDWDLRASDSQATLIPDAIVTLALPGAVKRQVLAVEVDTGTEAASLLLHKLVRYREKAAMRQPLFGTSPAVVVVVTKTERRARTLARHAIGAAAHDGVPLLLFGTDATILADGGITTGLARSGDLVTAEKVAKVAFWRGVLKEIGVRR